MEIYFSWSLSWASLCFSDSVSEPKPFTEILSSSASNSARTWLFFGWLDVELSSSKGLLIDDRAPPPEWFVRFWYFHMSHPDKKPPRWAEWARLASVTQSNAGLQFTHSWRPGNSEKPQPKIVMTKRMINSQRALILTGIKKKSSKVMTWSSRFISATSMSA